MLTCPVPCGAVDPRNSCGGVAQRQYTSSAVIRLFNLVTGTRAFGERHRAHGIKEDLYHITGDLHCKFISAVEPTLNSLRASFDRDVLGLPAVEDSDDI